LNRHQDAFDISKNIVVPEPKHAVTVFSQATITYHVRGRLVVLPTVDFNNQSSFSADKVADVTKYRLLPYELVPVDLAIADSIPQNYFRIRLVGSQPSCDSDCLFVVAPHRPAPCICTLSKMCDGSG
jgi:hypothetical protein